MTLLTSLKNLEYVTKYLYDKPPTMTELGVLIKDGVKEVKIRNKGNYSLFTYEFDIDAKRYQEVKETFDNVKLTTHRWKGINQRYITVFLSQKIDNQLLQGGGLMYGDMKGLESTTND